MFPEVPAAIPAPKIQSPALRRKGLLWGYSGVTGLNCGREAHLATARRRQTRRRQADLQSIGAADDFEVTKCDFNCRASLCEDRRQAGEKANA